MFCGVEFSFCQINISTQLTLTPNNWINTIMRIMRQIGSNSITTKTRIFWIEIIVRSHFSGF